MPNSSSQPQKQGGYTQKDILSAAKADGAVSIGSRLRARCGPKPAMCTRGETEGEGNVKDEEWTTQVQGPHSKGAGMRLGDGHPLHLRAER